VKFLTTQRPALKSYKRLQTDWLDVEGIIDEKVVGQATPFTSFGLGEGDTGETTRK
jgi:hypothetical protein